MSDTTEPYKFVPKRIRPKDIEGLLGMNTGSQHQTNDISCNDGSISSSSKGKNASEMKFVPLRIRPKDIEALLGMKTGLQHQNNDFFNSGASLSNAKGKNAAEMKFVPTRMTIKSEDFKDPRTSKRTKSFYNQKNSNPRNKLNIERKTQVGHFRQIPQITLNDDHTVIAGPKRQQVDNKKGGKINGNGKCVPKRISANPTFNKELRNKENCVKIANTKRETFLKPTAIGGKPQIPHPTKNIQEKKVELKSSYRKNLFMCKQTNTKNTNPNSKQNIISSMLNETPLVNIDEVEEDLFNNTCFKESLASKPFYKKKLNQNNMNKPTFALNTVHGRNSIDESEEEKLHISEPRKESCNIALTPLNRTLKLLTFYAKESNLGKESKTCFENIQKLYKSMITQYQDNHKKITEIINENDRLFKQFESDCNTQLETIISSLNLGQSNDEHSLEKPTNCDNKQIEEITGPVIENTSLITTTPKCSNRLNRTVSTPNLNIPSLVPKNSGLISTFSKSMPHIGEDQKFVESQKLYNSFRHGISYFKTPVKSRDLLSTPKIKTNIHNELSMKLQKQCLLLYETPMKLVINETDDEEY